MPESITFEIKTEHIRDGVPGDCSRCMVALAIEDACGLKDYEGYPVVVIDNEEIKIEGVRYRTRTVINDIIYEFDKLGQSFTFAENYKPVYTLTRYDNDSE